MNERKTMTLNLTEREMQILEELSRKKELSKTAVVRQALRLYQVIDARLSDGEKLFFEDERSQRRSEVMVLYDLLSFSRPAAALPPPPRPLSHPGGEGGV